MSSHCLIRGRQRRRSCDRSKERFEDATCWPKGGGRGYEPRDVASTALEMAKGKEMDFILEPLQRAWPC